MQNESFEIKKKQQLDHSIKQTLSFNPPIWARVREENLVRKIPNYVSSLDRKYASPLTTSGVIKVVSIIPRILQRDICLGLTPPGECTSKSTINFAKVVTSGDLFYHGGRLIISHGCE
jgi:hypothetical protein